MGKASKAKWEARVERAREATARALKPTITPKTALSWCRNVGLVSLLVGAYGLIQTFFWPSVTAIYIGIFLLLLDLFFEEFDQVPWIKYVIYACILVMTAMFTKVIVFRKSPLVSTYRTVNGSLEVIISNDSEDDYEGLDLKIRPDFPNDYVREPVQMSKLPGVNFIDGWPFISTTQFESVVMTVSTEDAEGAKDASTNFLRFTCDRLPSLSALKLQMKLTNSSRVPVTGEVSTVLIEGKFKGRFRVVKVKEQSSHFEFPRK